MNTQFESCPYCGKDSLKRSHSSLYELNGWLHICKLQPLRCTKPSYNKNDSQTYQDDGDNTLDFLYENIAKNGVKVWIN